MKNISKEEALERLRYICSKSEKCLYDVRKKLLEWDLSNEFDAISRKLLDENFIDEYRYVQSFVNDKIKFSKWGKIKISYQLKMRGIEVKYINKVINEYPMENYLLLVKNEVDKKTRSLKESDKYKRIQKLYAFATQRGFESDIVRTIIDEIEH